MKLQDLLQFHSGSPQFRITESSDINAPLYYFYGQPELENDLVDLAVNAENAKEIHTKDEVSTVSEGDILFSLISGRTTIVRSIHHGYLYTQNYIKLIPKEEIDKQYLVYILNESDHIRKQWMVRLQGSAVLKHTVKDLRELDMPQLHPFEKQKSIGEIYFAQIKLQALKNRAANTEKRLTLEKLRKVDEK